MVVSTRVTFLMTYVTGGVLSVTPRATPISAPSSRVKRMARVCTNGRTGRSTMASGAWVSNMGTACGPLETATATSVSGDTARLRVKGYKDGRTGTGTRADGNSA